MGYWRQDWTVQDASGRAIPNASVYWCVQPARTTSVPPIPLATLYNDSNGDQVITNPQVTNGFGQTYAYLAAGTYTVVEVYNGKVQQVYADQAIGVQAIGGAVLTNPSGPQTISNYGLTVPSLSVGSSITAGGNITVAGTLTTTSFNVPNAIADATSFSGATADVQINAAIATLPNGGIVDCRNYGATSQTLAATVNVGNSSKKIDLLFNRSTVFTATITNGSNVFTMGQECSMRAEGNTETNGSMFRLSSTANIADYINFSSVVGSLSGLSISGNTQATVRGAILHLVDVVQTTDINCVTIGGNINCFGVLVESNSSGSVGPINFNNLVVDGSGLTGFEPVYIRSNSSTGVIQCVNFFGGSLTHPAPAYMGVGTPIVQIFDPGGNQQNAGVSFFGTQFESSNSTDIGIYVNGTRNVTIVGANFTAHGGVPGFACVQIAGANAHGVTIINLCNFSGWTHTINDVAHVLTNNDYQISQYVYGAALAATSQWVDQANGLQAQIDTNGLSAHVNSTVYAALFKGADIGAQINAAYAYLPSTGGTIVIPAGKWTYTTPIAFTTSGKFVNLVGAGCVSTATGNVVGGSVLNFTPTTVSGSPPVTPCAITVDFCPATGSGGTTAKFSNFMITNGTSYTLGGNGSSAVGVQFGIANGGGGPLLFENVAIRGFGNGIQIPNGVVDWGTTFLNCTMAWNTVGLEITAPGYESCRFIGGQVMFNLIGFNLQSYACDMKIWGTSIDANTSQGINMVDGAKVYCTDCHFENTGGTTTHFITGTSTSQVNISGGIAYDDSLSGSTDYWFNGGVFNVNGLHLNSNGETCSTVFSVGTRALLNVANDSPAYLTGLGFATVCTVLQAGTGTTLQAAGSITVAGALSVTGNVGFFGTTATTKPTVTGSKGSNAALASLLTALANVGLVTDSTT